MGNTRIMGNAKATVSQMKAYIKSINPNVPQSVLDMIKYYISEGKIEGVRGDIAFAQSCLETGNFTFVNSAVTLNQNNFAGIGVTSRGMEGNSWDTPQLGIRAQIQHLKAYASTQPLGQSCVDNRYSYVEKGSAPYVEWLGIQENPKRKGWAAGKDYGKKILNILGNILNLKTNTTKDDEVNDMDITINKKFIKTNQTPLKRSKNNIQYIVVHYVGALGGALDNVNYYAERYRGASADFFVGHNGEIYQAVDLYNAFSWHCGGGLQGSGGASHYGKCTNTNSIGIEICVRKRSTSTMNATDKDWYFTDAAYQSAVKLVKKLMKELDIDINHVIRHYDVNGKICPNPFVYNTGNYTWTGFKKAICGIGNINTVTNNNISNWSAIGTATCTGNNVNVRKTPGGEVIGMLGKGNRFEIDGKTSGGWVHVNVANIGIGYVSTQYVKLDAQKQISTSTKYRVQAGTFRKKANAQNLAKQIKNAGFDNIIIQEAGLYKIQCGVFKEKDNANILVNNLKIAGFDAIINTL